MTTLRTFRRHPKSTELRYGSSSPKIHALYDTRTVDQNHISGHVRPWQPHSHGSTSHTLWLLSKTFSPPIGLTHEHSQQVWPSFWTKGTGVAWPNGGEIDIIEAINLMNNNQYVVHTSPGCTLDPSAKHTGNILGTSCSQGSGCVVAETKANSYGAGFAQAGGGVYATQLDAFGIYMWFWSVSHGLAGSDLISRVSYFDSDLTSRPTFGQQRLHLLSTHPPGDRLALHTPAQPANIPSTLHLNNSCSRRLYVALGNHSFFPLHISTTDEVVTNRAGTPGTYASTCHTPTKSCVSCPPYLSLEAAGAEWVLV